MAGADMFGELQRLGFPDVLLWLLTFAVIFGILSQTQMPKSKASRGIIAIGIATLVMLSAPANLLLFLSEMSSGLVLVVIAVLILVAFVETAGVTATKQVARKDEKTGKTVFQNVSVPIFQAYGKIFAIIFVIIVMLIFLGAGGWQLLGFGNITPKGIGSESMLGIIFLAAVVIGVLWMIMESKEGA
ncbi:MAG: hypothetical protein QXD77_03500 [Candidatus Aenigmatarchaeota archaeon]